LKGSMTTQNAPARVSVTATLANANALKAIKEEDAAAQLVRMAARDMVAASSTQRS